MEEKLRIPIPVAVEGKYDRIKLLSVIDAHIITTDGFGVFSSDEKKLLIRRLAEPRGLIVLTDSDGAGLVIRKFFRSILPKEKLIDLYTPKVAGRERRKKAPSKAGLLGVEGIDAEILRGLFRPFADAANTAETKKRGREVTKADFYADGLSGGEGSADRRARLCGLLGLPDNISSNALLAALNLLSDYDGYKELLENV